MARVVLGGEALNEGQTMLHDRRECPRIPITLAVRGLGEDLEPRKHRGDLSLGGVGFECARVPCAEVFHVAFSLPGDQQSRDAYAQVVDVRAQGTSFAPVFLGLRFLEIDDAHERAIARAIDHAGEAWKSLDDQLDRFERC